MWSSRCEVTRRFSFEECQALVCRGMDIDGEYFIHKTRDSQGEPSIQLIESHRVGDQFGSQETIDGVGLDAWGAPVFYRLLEDDGIHNDLPATSILHIYEPEWAGGVRSHPTIQHSINHVLDEMELLALEKHAVKDNADVSRILKTALGEIDGSGDFVVGAYVIGDAIARGSLPPIPGWWKISTVPPKLVTVDAGLEARQNRSDVEMGLKTLSDHFNEQGADFGEEIERRASDAKLILETAEKYGIPVEMLWKPS
jgi:capsid protein